MQNNYTLAQFAPVSSIHADLGFSALLMSAPLWVGTVNQWMAMIGGVLGITIALTRIWRMWRGKE